MNNNHYTVSERWFIQHRIAIQTLSNAWKVTKTITDIFRIYHINQVTDELKKTAGISNRNK